MRDLNKVILVGRLGADPVLRTTQSGKSMATLSLATETWSKEKQEAETTWHRLIAWEKQAENCQSQLQKGMTLFIEGRMKTRKYEDAGVTKYMTEVHVDSFLPLRGKAAVPAAETAAEAVN